MFTDSADTDANPGVGEAGKGYWGVDMGGSILPVVLGNALLGAKKGERWAVAFAVSLTALGRQSTPFAHLGLTVWQQPRDSNSSSSDGGSEWLVVFSEVDVAKVRQRSSASAASKTTTTSSSSSSGGDGDTGVHGNNNPSSSVSFSSAPPNVYDSFISNAGTGTMTGSSSASSGEGNNSSVDDEQAETEAHQQQQQQQQQQQPLPQPLPQQSLPSSSQPLLGHGSDNTMGSVSDLAARMAKIGGVGVGLHMAAAVAAVSRGSVGADAPNDSDGKSSSIVAGADAVLPLASTTVADDAQPSSSNHITTSTSTTSSSSSSSSNSAPTQPSPVSVSEGSDLAPVPLRSPTLSSTHTHSDPPRPVVRDEEGLGQQLALVLAQLSALRGDVNTLLTLEDGDEEVEGEDKDCGNDDVDDDEDEDGEEDEDDDIVDAKEVECDGDAGKSASSSKSKQGWSCAGRGTRIRGTRIISAVRKLVGDFGLALARTRRQARLHLRTELAAAQSREDSLKAEAEAAASATVANTGGSSVAESGTLQALRLTIERLEAKNEALQTRADRLMEEKVELLTRTAAATATALAMQQQMEAMRLASSSKDKDKDKEKDTSIPIDGASTGTGATAESQLQSPQTSTIIPPTTTTAAVVVGGGGIVTSEEGDGTWSTVSPATNNNSGNNNSNGSNAKKKKGKK